MNAISIVTKPLAHDILLTKMPVFKPNGTLKDSAKIAEDLAKKQAKWLEEAASNPLTCEIHAIAIYDAETAQKTVLRAVNGKTEKDILKEFLSMLVSDVGEPVNVAFKMKDIAQMLIRRAAVYGNLSFTNLYTHPYHSWFSAQDRGSYIDEKLFKCIAKMWAIGSIASTETLDEIVDVIGLPRVSIENNYAHWEIDPVAADEQLAAYNATVLDIYQRLEPLTTNV